MLASESFDWNNRDGRVEHEGLVSVIEMAHKTKTMLTQAQHNKIRKENAQRAWDMKNRGAVKKEKREKGQEKETGMQRGRVWCSERRKL